MKYQHALILFLLAYSLAATGCATLVKGDKSHLYLLNAPKDIAVYNGDSSVHVEAYMDAYELYGLADSWSDEMNSTKTSYHYPGITLPCNRSYNLTLVSGKQKADVAIEPNMRMKWWFWLDLFSSGGIGIFVDAYTGCWNDLAPVDGEKNMIDVSKYLDVSKYPK